MNWVPKDYPEFNHLDTLIITSPKPTDSSESLYPHIYTPHQANSPSISFIKKSQKSSYHQSSRSEMLKLPTLSLQTPSSEPKITQTLRMKIQDHLEKKKKIPRKLISTNEELLYSNISQRTKEFMSYLNTLSDNVPGPKYHQNNKNNSLQKIPFPDKANLKKSSRVYSISLETPINPIKLDRKRNNNNKKVGFQKKSNQKKITTINRFLLPNYYELKDQIKAFLLNLSEIKEILSNSKKVYVVIKSFLIYRSILLSKILLNDENECLNEPLIENTIENQCFVKEIHYEGISIKYKEKMNPYVIAEFKELNEKIEAYNTSHAIEKIKTMEKEVIDEFHKIKYIEDKLRELRSRNVIFKDYHPVEKYNYKNIPVTGLVEQISHLEDSHGGCEFIHNRSRLICQAIESSVKNVRSECDDN